ncbi:hypothetical protein AB1N83_008036 [Pleurotus pulmonarius]
MRDVRLNKPQLHSFNQLKTDTVILLVTESRWRLAVLPLRRPKFPLIWSTSMSVDDTFIGMRVLHPSQAIYSSGRVQT